MNWRIKQGGWHDRAVFTVLITLLCLYGIAVFLINFSGNPVLFCTDMYSDMIFSAEVWEHKSIFPDGWVFGNQVYTVATPIVAALFYGLTANHSISMGIASSLMGILVLVSFDWMLKPIVKEKTARLAGCVTFISLVLFLGDGIYTVNGWQLFFTLCSYYTCYAITAFLAFGCYLRSESIFSRRQIVILLLTCVLSFGTGVQSVRQTAIMSVPLVAMEVLCMGLRLIQKEHILTKSSLVAFIIALINIAGVILFKTLDIPQVEIFGQLKFIDISAIFSSLADAIRTALSLFSALYAFLNAKLLLILLFAAFTLVSYGIIHKAREEKNTTAIICYGLFIISIAVILVIDTITTMSVREIYYFMIYPLMAVAAAYIFSNGKKAVRIAVIVLLIVIFLFCCIYKLPDTYHAAMDSKRSGYEEVSDFLLAEGYCTIYSGWNCGEKLAIASDFQLQAGFWALSRKPFAPVKYLCNPAVFQTDSSKCAYVFFGKDYTDVCLQTAKEIGLQLDLLKYFPESDIYVFTSPINIMQLDLQG